MQTLHGRLIPRRVFDWLTFDGGNSATTLGRSYLEVSGQLGAGGEYDGWRYATISEINKFITNVSGVAFMGSTANSAYDGITDAVAAVLGYTDVNVDFTAIKGLSADDGSSLGIKLVVQLLDSKISLIGLDVWSTGNGSGISGSNSSVGSWLVRTTTTTNVAEPSTLALFAIALAGFSVHRRKSSF